MGEREMTMRVLYICCQIAVLFQQLSNILIITVDESTVLQSVFFFGLHNKQSFKAIPVSRKIRKIETRKSLKTLPCFRTRIRHQGWGSYL